MKNNDYRRKSYMKNSLLVAVVVINLFLLVAVANLMQYTQTLLNDDTRLNLTEIVTQNKDVITSKIKLEINNLNTTAEHLAKEYAKTPYIDTAKMKAGFLGYADAEKEPTLFLALRDGQALFPGGVSKDVTDRTYYKLAMQGTQNISDPIISKLNGKEIFVISVPFYYNNKIIGTVQKIYSVAEMHEICSVSLFSEKGHMYMINSQGDILLSTQLKNSFGRTENYYNMVKNENPNQSKELIKAIENKKDGFMELELDGEQKFAAYTPIEEAYDWYLISSIPMTTVSPNSSVVVKIFYAVLFGVVMIFAVSVIYFLYFKNKQQANLENLAFVDSVTEGNTYTRFLIEIQEIFESHGNEEFYMMSFDIDNFKYFNNFYGFDFGDRVLKTVYEKFARLIGTEETIARVYSDNFVMLLKEVSEERMKMFATMELKIEGLGIFISGGIYKIVDTTESSRLMMDKARMAAKGVKGVRFKDIAVYTEEHDRKMISDENIKRDIEKALSDDEIIPFYQPKVDVNTRELVGAEALARWITQDGKVVSPADFIPVCERTGLIVMVDMEIFKKTILFLKKQIKNGVKCVPISVNFSRLHLQNPTFLDELMLFARKQGVPTELIEIELTETVIFENHHSIDHLIEHAHLYGITISMDDFGSGYSSLHMLKDIPIDVVKVDGGFLKGVDLNEKNKIIFSAITKMIKDLDIKLVVEGVETESNVDLMKEVGASIAQGYFYSRPLKENDFETVYIEGKV